MKEHYNNISMLAEFKPNYCILFYKEDKKIGGLDWNDGVLKFSGNIEESAKIFFDFLKGIIDKYIENEIKKKA